MLMLMRHLFSRATKAFSARDPHHHNVDVDVEKEVTTVQQVVHVCGNGNKVHCCNSETAVGGLLGLNLDNILSGCQEINIPVLAVNVPFKDVCTQQAICCGDVKQKVSRDLTSIPKRS
jgi:Leu/Phe-tRNA-protein transferase